MCYVAIILQGSITFPAERSTFCDVDDASDILLLIAHISSSSKLFADLFEKKMALSHYIVRCDYPDNLSISPKHWA